jgi:hypothetical protein
LLYIISSFFTKIIQFNRNLLSRREIILYSLYMISNFFAMIIQRVVEGFCLMLKSIL